MNVLIKAILIIALAGIIFAGVSVFNGQDAVSDMIAKFKPAFDFVVGNANNLNDILPVNDVLLAVGAIFSIEAMILIFKAGKFIVKLFRGGH